MVNILLYKKPPYIGVHQYKVGTDYFYIILQLLTCVNFPQARYGMGYAIPLLAQKELDFTTALQPNWL